LNCCVYGFCFLQTGNTPGLVQRLLLLEAVQQPDARSFLAQTLTRDWQQQQHLDLAHVACGSSSSSSGPPSVKRVWMPQLLTALLQHGLGEDVQDSAAVLRELKALVDNTRAVKQQQQQPRSTDAQRAVAAAVPDGCEDVSRAIEGSAAEATLADSHPAAAAAAAAAAGSGGDDGSARSVVEGAAASYMLGCLSDAACRSSLACWVLTWHGCMLQQGGNYGSVASRCV
jgi:hypothetical protein